MIGNYIRKWAQECIFTMHALVNLVAYFVFAKFHFVELVAFYLFHPFILMDKRVCIAIISLFFLLLLYSLLYTLVAIVIGRRSSWRRLQLRSGTG